MVYIFCFINIYCELKVLVLGEDYLKYREKYILKKKVDIDILKMYVFYFFLEDSIVFFKFVVFISTL